jgi:hypothetical protein
LCVAHVAKRTKEQVLLTIMFNKNSVILMILIEDETMDAVIEVFDKLKKALGIRRFRKLFPVILTDNGRCFKNAMALEYTKSGSPRTKVFYCDPQASWQKPHIEKRNALENIRTLSYAYINFYIEHPTYYSFMYRNTYIKIEFTMEKKEENYPPYNVFREQYGRLAEAHQV